MQAVTITRKHVVMVSTHIYFFMSLILISMINIPHFGKRITDYLTSRLTRMKSVCFFFNNLNLSQNLEWSAT